MPYTVHRNIDSLRYSENCSIKFWQLAFKFYYVSMTDHMSFMCKTVDSCSISSPEVLGSERWQLRNGDYYLRFLAV